MKSEVRLRLEAEARCRGYHAEEDDTDGDLRSIIHQWPVILRLPQRSGGKDDRPDNQVKVA